LKTPTSEEIIIQYQKRSLVRSSAAVSPEEAKKHLPAMSPEQRALYEEC
jgi:hypothetical protein